MFHLIAVWWRVIVAVRAGDVDDQSLYVAAVFRVEFLIGHGKSSELETADVGKDGGAELGGRSPERGGDRDQ
jgi:hypothetical protein